jgi:diguanylate cyclase (GGDEF)-like protein
MDFVAPEDYAVVQPFSSGEGMHGGGIEGIQMLQESGDYLTVNLSITELEQNPFMTGWLVVVSATANSVLHQTRRLAGGGYYSLYDPVTALPNRLLFIDRLDHAIERAGRIHSVMCCIVVSIDNLTDGLLDLAIEDMNQVFCEFGRRLHQSMREGDTIARVGDADFAILAEGVGGAAEARMLGERIVAALREPFVTETGTLTLRSSIGAAISKPSGQNAGNLLRDATAAMEYSRKVGGARNTIFEDSMRKTVVDSLRIEGELQGLHERGELQIFYQPEVDIEDERVLAAEALVRWEHPRHGLILPGEFLSLAEEAGLLDEIGLWTIESVCATVQGWRKQHANAGSLTGVVNLTPRQLEAESFVNSVAAILDHTGLPGANLRLEISDSERKSIARWRDVAVELRALGIQVGLQDVNVAELTADMLETLPVDTIKIDRTAMNTPVQNPSRPSQSTPLAQMAGKHAFDVVVAGIETAQHLARARIYGYRQGQGFYFYRPVPAQTVEYLLVRGLNREQAPVTVELRTALAATA